MMKFYNGGILEQTEKIDCRVDSNLVYCVYTDYASDMNGDYTYFIGQEVSSLDSLPDGLTTCTIPAQDYEKFISDLGQAPDIIMNVWKKIWNANLNRTYKADFEVYNRSQYYENQKLYNKELY